MKSLYEELGGTYRQVGNYLIPDIELPERNYEIGKFGRMRHRYCSPECANTASREQTAARVRKHRENRGPHKVD